MAKSVDWELVEIDYRAGKKSVRELASHHSVSHTAVIKRAASHGWTRDLKGKVSAMADAIVAKEAVFKEKRGDTKVTEQVIVAVEAQVEARIRLAHRADITRMRLLVLRLLTECEAESADPAIFEWLGELLRNPDEKGQDRLNEAYQKAISLPQRIKGVKELAETLRVLIALEREAYGIGGDTGRASDFEKLLSDIHEATVA